MNIERLGVHVPRWSLDRQELAANWTAKSGPGARSVANFDEDALTMGVEAALAALGPERADRAEIDAVLFVTTSPVFAEKQHAAVVATVLGLGTAQCVDITGSLRGGLDAVRLATALVDAGSARRVLVVAADRRDLQPGGPHERLSGDAAAAVVVGPGPGLLGIDAIGAVTDPGAGIWRLAGDRSSSVADDRFVAGELLAPWLTAAGEAACGTAGLSAADLAGAAFSAPLSRVEQPVAKKLKVDLGEGSALLDREIGYCGVAHPFLQLARLLAERAPGQRILVAAAGDGATALVGTVGDGPREDAAGAIDRALARRRSLAVGMYQRIRGQLPMEPVNPYTSEMLLRREQTTSLGLLGSRCLKCNRGHFPPRRICLECKAIDSMEPLELPRSGVLFTHTVEHLFPVPVNQLIMGVVDLGDARLYTQVTDSAPEECSPGQPVDLVVRRLHDGGHLPHYFWKAVVDNSGVAS